MTRDEFTARNHEPCLKCVSRVRLVYNPNNNAHQVLCSHCETRTPWGQVMFVKYTEKPGTRRKEYQAGQELDTVWERFGHVCAVCSLSTQVLISLGVGRTRHHVAEYAKTGHDGVIIPLCTNCKPFVDARQREAARWYKRVQDGLT